MSKKFGFFIANSKKEETLRLYFEITNNNNNQHIAFYLESLHWLGSVQLYLEDVFAHETFKLVPIAHLSKDSFSKI